MCAGKRPAVTGYCWTVIVFLDATTKPPDHSKWKHVHNYPEYKISKQGRIWSCARKMYKKLTIRPDGYLSVGMSRNNRTLLYLVHRLVAVAYLKKPVGCDKVNHKDGNKQHDVVTNLEWRTQSGNIRHAIETGLSKAEKAVIQLDSKSGKEIARFKSATIAGKTLNIGRSDIVRYALAALRRIARRPVVMGGNLCRCSYVIHCMTLVDNNENQ